MSEYVTIRRDLLERVATAVNIYAPDDREHSNLCGEILAALAQREAQPVKFLADGTRFKLSFFESEDDGCGNVGTYVTCFEGWEKELGGRWVALVPAENDCHRTLAAAPPAQAEQAAQQGEPSDEAIHDIVRSVGLDWHAGFTLNDDEENRYAQLVHAVLALRPARSARQPLTEDEIIRVGKEARATEGPHILPITFARAIERAHGIADPQQGDER